MKLYMGIDWSEKKHDICYLHENGEVLRRIEVKHSMPGFVAIDKAREELGITAGECEVGLETAHSLLVDYLWDQGYEKVYILPPNTVKSARGRYRQSGAKDDRWDARLIADILRTDHKRYTPWKPDSQLTRQIRAAVRFVSQLNKDIRRNSNRMRAVLLRYYPIALNVFSKVHSPIALAFIQTYPTPQSVSGLSYKEFKKFLREHRHSQPKKWAKNYSHLLDPYPQANEETIAVYQQQATSLARVLEILVKSKKDWMKQMNELYQQHPDREIYAALPGAGEFLEPALLSKLGDDRQRYPTAKVLQAVAGTCPITKRSGKRNVVYFRRSCDREFRNIVQQWARFTLDSSPWAQNYYRSVRPRCSSENDAIRRLANRWLAILWRIWQDRKPYDQEYHLKQHTLRCKPRSQ